jgi:hypothetical protein
VNQKLIGWGSALLGQGSRFYGSHGQSLPAPQLRGPVAASEISGPPSPRMPAPARHLVAVPSALPASTQPQASQYGGTLPERRCIRVGSGTLARSTYICDRGGSRLRILSTPRMYCAWRTSMRASRAVAIGLFYWLAQQRGGTR